jgi:photosystem II stability/assembly factor-like uncharacterized protein
MPFYWYEQRPAGDINSLWYEAASNASGARLIACVYNGRIYLSTDYGNTWSEVKPGGDYDLAWQCVASNSDGMVLLAGVGGTYVYISTNGGDAWTNTGLPSAGWTNVTSSADGTKLAACAYNGRIYVSVNSGASWGQALTPQGNVNYLWRAIHYSKDGTALFAAAYGGRFYKSINDGMSWTELTPEGNSGPHWCSVKSSSDGLKVVASNFTTTYMSSNGGDSWTSHALGSGFKTLAVNSDCSLILLGDMNGHLYTSVDFGATWNTERVSFIGSTSTQWKAVAINTLGDMIWAGVFDGRFFKSPIPALTFSGPPFGTSFDTTIHSSLQGITINPTTLDSNGAAAWGICSTIEIPSPFNIRAESIVRVRIKNNYYSGPDIHPLFGLTLMNPNGYTYFSAGTWGYNYDPPYGFVSYSRLGVASFTDYPEAFSGWFTTQDIPVIIHTIISVGPDPGDQKPTVTMTIEAFSDDGNHTLLATVTRTVNSSVPFDVSRWQFSYLSCPTINAPDYWQTVQLSFTPATVSPPVISPDGGAFSEPVAVVLSDVTSGAAIHYTLDGSTPMANSLLYINPITLISSRTVKAIAMKAGLQDSSIVSADFTVNWTSKLKKSGEIKKSVLTGQGTRDFKLNLSDGSDGTIYGLQHDIAVEEFELILIDGVEQIRQKLKIRLQFFAGEWYLDTTVGTRYYQDVLIKNPPLSKLQSLFKAVIVGTTGVTELTAFSTTYDPKNRTFALSFTVNTLYGSLSMSETLI